MGLLHATAIDDLRKRTRRLGRIEAKLDLLMRNAGIEFGPYEGLPAQVVDALNRGDKLEAVKFYCFAAAVSLKEAKTSSKISSADLVFFKRVRRI
jgi:hypothetical protein